MKGLILPADSTMVQFQVLDPGPVSSEFEREQILNRLQAEPMIVWCDRNGYPCPREDCDHNGIAFDVPGEIAHQARKSINPQATSKITRRVCSCMGRFVE